MSSSAFYTEDVKPFVDNNETEGNFMPICATCREDAKGFVIAIKDQKDRKEHWKQRAKVTFITFSVLLFVALLLLLYLSLKPCDDAAVFYENCAEKLAIRGFQGQGHWEVIDVRRSSDLEGQFTYLQLLCDQTSDGGGWTLFQKRGQFGNPENYFNRSYSEYEDGFGDFDGEFWLGLRNIRALTNNNNDVHLKVIMEMWNGSAYEVTYEKFSLGPSFKGYPLRLGKIVDSRPKMDQNGKDPFNFHRNRPFSAPDHDVDGNLAKNCAVENESGWWFSNCRRVNFNGRNCREGNCGLNVWGKTKKGIHWYNFGSKSLKATTMMLRYVN